MAYTCDVLGDVIRRRPAVAVFGVALLVRQGLIAVAPGGLSGDFAYDPGVYYSAADTLLGGHLPYRDFILLHPPGLMLVLTPFAALGRLTTDHAGFMTACLAFTVLGALNAALVSAIAGRLGYRRRAALAGGLFYALWLGTATTEVLPRLEPLGNTAFLLGLFALAGQDTRRSRVLAGVALGCAVCVKIWWVVPVLIVVLAVALRASWRAAVPVLAGAVGAAVVVCAPFFLAAPSDMWHMVITDQLGRGVVGAPTLRVLSVSGVHAVSHAAGTAAAAVTLTVCLVLFITLALAARRVRWGWLIVALTAVQLALLAVAPSYFDFYAAFVGTGVALLVAAGAAGARLPSGVSAAVVTAVAVITVIGVAGGNVAVSKPAPLALAAQARHVHCLMTDSPSALIELNVLTHTIENGCPNWVDVSGRTYGRDAPPRVGLSRVHNQKWQRDLRRYLLSGDAVLVVRPSTGASAATMRYLRRRTVPCATDRGKQLRLVRARLATSRLRCPVRS